MSAANEARKLVARNLPITTNIADLYHDSLIALLAEHEALLARIEAAPAGTVTSFDTSGAWIVTKADRAGVYEPLRG